jgi:hypothetical protein
MRHILALSGLLVGCGYETAPWATECESVVFERVSIDYEASCEVMAANVDVALSLLEEQGVVTSGRFKNTHLQIMSADRIYVSDGSGTNVFGVAWLLGGQDIIQLNRRGQFLAHEMLHVAEKNLSHDGWVERGFYDVHNRYVQLAQPLNSTSP